MNTSTTALNDQAFIEQFEAFTLPATEFSHLGHLRIAWLYLRRYPQVLAIEKTCSGIKTYAESLGAKDKFHLTITDALVRIMAIRMKEQAGEGWQAFAEENPDLVSDALAVLAQYYSQAQLWSERAKKRLVAPDLKPIV